MILDFPRLEGMIIVYHQGQTKMELTITQPSRTAFWRFVLALTCLFAFLAVRDLIVLAGQLNVDIFSSRTWLAGLSLLILLASFALIGILISFSKARDRLWGTLEAVDQVRGSAQWMGVIIVLVSLIGFSFVSSMPYFRRLLGNEQGIRFLIFWGFSLMGMWGIRLWRREIPWLNALGIIVLCQSIFHLLLVTFSAVTSYPFAMGWSETSRYYFPSLFLSEIVYGENFPLPILHPTLHLLLTPPYWFDAPLLVHRFWLASLRLVLVGAIVPALMKRLSIPKQAIRYFVALWMFLFLFMGPVYFHLAVPVILLLIGFSPQDDRRTWVAVILASLWCGWSRVNWYPVPGMIAAVLYLMETPCKGRNFWQYLLKPASWFLTGTLIAFLFQRVYVALSGVPDEYFYTSLSSALLWYRLLPNASYAFGILPAALLASVPVWIAIYILLRSRNGDWHPLRLTLILAALVVLFLGGLVVSLKIGGGADLHNLDAYFVLSLIVLSYLAFGRYRREDGEFKQPVSLHWIVVVLLIVMPAWSYLKFNIGFGSYDANRTDMTLGVLQEYVDQVNAQGGEILFITQRHLISMGMLENVTLVPEYEREDLMEMAMANQREYLGAFRRDMENQRFALIVVDPLNYRLLGKNYPFGEENNVWVLRVMKHILCNYREEKSFPEDSISLYVPQKGERTCPR
jgi:hypothetical protein